MRNFIIFLMFFATNSVCAQQVGDYFVPSANHYLQDETKEALATVNEGLSKFPNDKKLQELKKKIEEQQQDDQKKGEQKKGEDQKENSDQSPEDSESQQKSGQQDGRNKGEDGSGSSDETPLNKEGKEDSQNSKDQGERLQKQRYDNILKALENQEQDTQRRLMMGKSKSKFGRKQKDW